MQTLYEQLGGDKGIEKVVELLYAKVMSDKDLAPFFDGIDICLQRRKFRLFLGTVTRGPLRRSRIELRAAHDPAVLNGLTKRHFLAFQSHLLDALVELGVPPQVVEWVIKEVSQTHDDVLGL